MSRRSFGVNWIAGPLIGGLGALFFIHASACSKTVQQIEPLSPAAQTAAVPSPNQAIEKVDLRGVEFRRDGSIGMHSEPILDSAVEMLKNKPSSTIYVDSYCDATGGKDVNLRLSDERAAAVASYLEQHGIPADHIVSHGFGASHFVATNATTSGRAQNRRIELVVEPAAVPTPANPAANPAPERLTSR
jgi:outer membrane protein OmpA-like peptidoglycan-associated protein